MVGNGRTRMPVQRHKIAFLHIPKTGGAALEHFLRHLYPDDPQWYFSFFGLDSSNGRNQVLIEAMQPGDSEQRRIASSAHFQNAHVVAGHFSANLAELFPDYSFRYFTILREPVSRVISNIYQYSSPAANGQPARFAGRTVPDRISDPGAYWAAVGGILREANFGRVFGLMPHESMMLNNGMCRMLAGAPLHTNASQVSVRAALDRANTMALAWFSDFNASVTSALASVGIPLVLDERTNRRGAGSPAAHTNHSPDYGCPDDVRHLITRMNQSDLELYRTLAPR